MELPHPLRTALVDVARIMEPARHDWWIIASAALALHGVDPGHVRDVDVLFDRRDGDALLESLNLQACKGTGDGLFRSDLFVTWTGTALPVELFAGFELHRDDVWTPVVLSTREAVSIDGYQLWVPSRAELHALLLRFGRDKDVARAGLLSPSGRSPSRSGSA